MPDRTKAIAGDLWEIMGKYGLRKEKSIVFCVDDTHAAFLAQELRRLSGDNDYAARITRAERNSHQLERNFAVVGPSNPRIAVTVGGDPPVDPGTKTIEFEAVDQYTLQAEAFVAAILEGTELPDAGANALGNIKTIERVFAAAGPSGWS